MARKSKTKHYPVVRRGQLFRQSPDPIGPNMEVDFAKNLSKVNRRLYRQARTYEVKLDIPANSTSAQINVYALADNWMNHRALKMAYDMYLENSESERSRLKEGNLARWEDFRTMSGAGITVADPLQYDETFNPSFFLQGEFGLTSVVDAAGQQKYFSWGAPTLSRYSILAEYDLAGDAQSTPDRTTNDAPYSELMADDSATMGSELQNNGNSPPYDADGVGADKAWVKVATLGTGASQKLSTGFFHAPCGLVLLNTVAGDNVPDQVAWEVKSGDYKGVSAPSMLE